MDNDRIKQELLQSAMELAAQQGWKQTTLTDAAHHCNIPPNTARKAFPCKESLLFYLNRLADQAALKQIYKQQPVPEYLFDLFMERFDVFQHYRRGLISALQTLPFNPPLALLMNLAIQNSMKWVAEAAEINVGGLSGIACVKGLTAIWILNMRVWIKDESPDMAQTMASLDRTLKQAGKIAPYLVKRTSKTKTEEQDASYFSKENAE